jgi:hypothetical protein
VKRCWIASSSPSTSPAASAIRARRVPGVRGTVFLRRELLGFRRQLVERACRSRHLERFSCARPTRRARLFEPLREALVHRRVGIGRAALPIPSAPLEPIERVFAVERLDALAERRFAPRAGAQLGLARLALARAAALASMPVAAV